MDFLGETLGSMAAAGKEVENFKRQYESFSDSQLEDEYGKLKSGSKSLNSENGLRYNAVSQILKQRGYNIN